ECVTMSTIQPYIILSLLAFSLLIAISAQVDDDLIVQTTQVRAFLGIPYGKPPIGKLRFQSPQPAEGWRGVQHVTHYSNSCLQPVDTSLPGFYETEMWNPNTNQSEDCLYLNIWTPPISNKTACCRSSSPCFSLAPVLVWIYGGRFTSGTASLDMYDGRFLSVHHTCILVGHRVGPLGFLSLPGSKVIRGNAGLQDQQLALRWVANNIGAFGGDPSKVTLFGESAGSASVGLHLLSPGSRGLFKRAILQSGSPNAPWSVLTQLQAWDRSVALGRLLGCALAPSAVLEQCLQCLIVKQQFNILPVPSLIALPFTTSIDGDFLTDMPEVLLRKGQFLKKEVLIGLNKDEGTYFLTGTPGFNITSQSLISREDFLKGVELELPGWSEIMTEAAILQYTNWTDENIGAKNRDSLGQIVGDREFNCPVLEFTKRPAFNCSPTGQWPRSSTNPWPAWMGVMHGYEIEIVFGKPLNSTLGYLEEEVVMSRRMMKYWANMARTGNPSIEKEDWPLFTLDLQEYITLNSAPPMIQRKLAANQCQLWTNFLPKLQNATGAM
uniref:Carboxylic ester hydrolase n=1 Tax=Esox lucius TaxID=8010 RepID=A0A3P8YC05_ESOLU